MLNIFIANRNSSMHRWATASVNIYRALEPRIALQLNSIEATSWNAFWLDTFTIFLTCIISQPSSLSPSSSSQDIMVTFPAPPHPHPHPFFLFFPTYIHFKPSLPRMQTYTDATCLAIKQNPRAFYFNKTKSLGFAFSLQHVEGFAPKCTVLEVCLL